MNFSEKLVTQYRKNANFTLARVCRLVALLNVLIGILNYLGVFVIEGKWMYAVIGASIFVALLPTVIFNVCKITSPWAQYLVLTLLSLMCSAMYAVLSYHSIIMLTFPLVCSCLYGEKKWIIFTMAIMGPLIVISHLVAFRLKVVPDEPLVTMHGVILYGIVPRLIQITAIGFICIGITSRLSHLVMALTAKNHELYENQQTLITSLSTLIETQSQETGLHVKRVSEYTKILCEELGYDSDVTWAVSISSMMHDVGKILVPPEILEKPGKLTPEEFEKIKLHVDFGRRMLEKSPGEIMQISAEISYQHHEKWDGTGYNHIQGEEISPYARIVAVADVFDALVSRRPYKDPWPIKKAYDEIVSQGGRHFDPTVVEAFKKGFPRFEGVLMQFPESREVSVDELIC